MNEFALILGSFLNLDGETKPFDIFFVEFDEAIRGKLCGCPVFILVFGRSVLVEHQKV